MLLCYKSQLFKEYCPAARTMPCARQLEGKYLPDVYSQHKTVMLEMMADTKVSIIMDESPDVIGRQAVNTLFCFYDRNKNSKYIVLVDTSILRAVNSTSLSWDESFKNLTRIGMTYWLLAVTQLNI